MTYKLFIDDERWPTTPDWMLVRSSREAILAVQYYGVPDHIAFDHDLGGEDTAMNFLNWFENQIVDNKLVLHSSFTFSVHSANPVGAANIQSRMEQLVHHFKLEE